MRPKFLGSFRALPVPLPVPPLWLFKTAALPLNALLTTSLRRVVRERPDVFQKLGRFQHAVFLIAPRDMPFAFRLKPLARQGAVEIVMGHEDKAYSVRISGTLKTLLGLFDGTIDADSSFFGGDISLEGATDAALALHNALEAAELGPGDILGLPARLKPAFNRLVAGLPFGARHGAA
ncbi:MAG: SCP2 sterol-binding domain-containing protein [Asticcacaulis sp.]|nr:SCP2 sterol-binding domain-containing protein [Asticcacaulis sp.]